MCLQVNAQSETFFQFLGSKMTPTLKIVLPNVNLWYKDKFVHKTWNQILKWKAITGGNIGNSWNQKTIQYTTTSCHLAILTSCVKLTYCQVYFWISFQVVNCYIKASELGLWKKWREGGTKYCVQRCVWLPSFVYISKVTSGNVQCKIMSVRRIFRDKMRIPP